MSVVFDKFAFMKRLEDAGITRPHAEAMSDAFHQAMVGTVATSQDIELLRRDLESTRLEIGRDLEITRLGLTRDLDTTRLELTRDFETTRLELSRDLETTRLSLTRDLDTTRLELTRDLENNKSALQDEISKVRVAIAESEVWTVGVGASIVAVLAAMKYFG